MIALNSPLQPDLKKVYKYLNSINEKGWYTNFGPLHNELTVRLQEYLNVKNLLLVNNGTSALQVAAKALGTETILSTPFSFVATVSAFKWQGHEVNFTDIDKETYNLSPQYVQDAFRAKCDADTIVATHVYGNPCDVKSFDLLAETNNKKLIYDAAHAFGVNVENQSVLNFGDASTLSFHATKVFHTIEGGAIVFKENDNYEKAKELINFGINALDGSIKNAGINAKLNEYQAAVGLTNLDSIHDVLQHRSNLFEQYREGLKGIVEVPKWHESANFNGAYMPIKLQNNKELNRIVTRLNSKGIQSRHYFSPSLDAVYKECKSFGTSNSRHISEGILCLPMHFHLSEKDVQKIINILVML